LFRVFNRETSLPNGEDQHRFLDAFRINSRFRALHGRGNASLIYRNVELLLGEPVFDGLSFAPDIMDERYGERDVAMLLMHFKSRSRAW
jgi:hypothetical protein